MFFTLENQIFLQSFTFESKKQHIVINSLSLIPQPGAGDISKVIREVRKMTLAYLFHKVHSYQRKKG